MPRFRRGLRPGSGHAEPDLYGSDMPRFRRGLRPSTCCDKAARVVRHAPFPKGIKTSDVVAQCSRCAVRHAPFPKGIKTVSALRETMRFWSDMPRFRRGLRHFFQFIHLFHHVRHAPFPKGIKTRVVLRLAGFGRSDMPRFRRGLRPTKGPFETVASLVRHAPFPKGIKTSCLTKATNSFICPTCPVSEGD